LFPLKRSRILPHLSLASGGCQQSLAFLGLQLQHSNLCLDGLITVFLLCLSICLHLTFLYGQQSLELAPPHPNPV
uniref:Uncharacterized protein n=1 Tax=Canis lupus familiaris TaxID=9615 RepID=A0A8C0QHR9_CANLF